MMGLILVLSVAVGAPVVYFEPVIQRWLEARDARLHAED